MSAAHGKIARMKTSNTRNAWFGLIGLGALAAYVIACTSFSPDGSKVLFPTFDAKSGHLAIGLYDCQSGKTENVFVAGPAVLTDGDKAPGMQMRPLWSPDGKRALVVLDSEPDDEKGKLSLVVVPLGAKEPVRLILLPNTEAKAANLITPPPIVGHYLFLGGEPLARLDLESAEVKTNHCGGCYLTAQGGQVYYLAKGDEDDYVVGKLDTEKLTLSPIVQLKKKDVGALTDDLEHQGTVSMPLVSRDGSRIALVCRDSETNSIVIYRGKELEKKVSWGPKAERVFLGNLEWGPGEQRIYTVYARDLKAEEPLMELGLADIPLDGEPVRQVPLCRIAGKGAPLAYFQFALSPDGKTAAVASTYLTLAEESFKPADCALFLVDLSSPEHKVNKIPIAVPEALKKKAEEK
jgi:hypothetical protein